jgi:hypothetical protein
VGRLAPGVTLAQGQAEMTVVARQVGQSGPGTGEAFGVWLTPTRPSLLADEYVGLLIVVRQGITLSLVGVAIGLVAALALNQVWESLLCGVRPMDLVVLAAVSLLLIATTLVASYLPARQATRVDPMTVMRAE